jgi:hypothetical protein
LYGCAITTNTNNILVGTGYFVIDGGLVQVSTQETIDAGASGTKKLCYQIDLSETNTETVFNQGSWVLITGDPTQQDLWGGGTIYQLPFCEVTTDGTSISAKTDLIDQIDGDYASLIASKVNISDIKDNLTSTDTDKPFPQIKENYLRKKRYTQTRRVHQGASLFRRRLQISRHLNFSMQIMGHAQ